MPRNECKIYQKQWKENPINQIGLHVSNWYNNNEYYEKSKYSLKYAKNAYHPKDFLGELVSYNFVALLRVLICLLSITKQYVDHVENTCQKQY